MLKPQDIVIVLVDAIRAGRARERNLAAKFLKEQMQAMGGKMDELKNKGYLISKVR